MGHKAIFRSVRFVLVLLLEGAIASGAIASSDSKRTMPLVVDPVDNTIVTRGTLRGPGPWNFYYDYMSGRDDDGESGSASAAAQVGVPDDDYCWLYAIATLGHAWCWGRWWNTDSVCVEGDGTYDMGYAAKATQNDGYIEGYTYFIGTSEAEFFFSPSVYHLEHGWLDDWECGDHKAGRAYFKISSPFGHEKIKGGNINNEYTVSDLIKGESYTYPVWAKTVVEAKNDGETVSVFDFSEEVTIVHIKLTYKG